jgi:NAD(P)H-hydrate epimerase
MIHFPEPTIPVPFVSSKQMVEVDRVMEEELGISLAQMMENAGRGLARLAVHRFMGGDPGGMDVVVLAGKGGNGGGALVAARRLSGWGARVRVRLAGDADDLGPVPKGQLQSLMRMGIPVEFPRSNWRAKVGGQDSHRPASLPLPSLILDGLLGYSLSGAPRGEVARLVEWSGRMEVPVLSLDLPSGLDATTGEPRNPTVKATATFTLALPKTGLLEEWAQGSVGELYLGDIGVPPQVYERFGLAVDGLFSQGEILYLVSTTAEANR